VISYTATFIFIVAFICEHCSNDCIYVASMLSIHFSIYIFSQVYHFMHRHMFLIHMNVLTTLNSMHYA